MLLADFKRLVAPIRGYRNCPSALLNGYEKLLGELSASSSLTSRRYPVWSVVRRNMDDVFLELIERFSGEWGHELIVDCRLSEMGKRPPSICAIPSGKTDSAYIQAWNEFEKESGDQLLESFISSDLRLKLPRKPMNYGWRLEASKRQRKLASVLSIDWQIESIGSWEWNFRCVLQNLSQHADENCVMLDALDLIVYELIPLLRCFRPSRATTHPEHENVRCDQADSIRECYCELCWRLTVRSVRLAEINLHSDAVQRSRERIKAGRLSNRYCSLHMPGTARYHADLRYRDAFKRHLDFIYRRRESDYVFNLQPPSSADKQELRKLAYDQVHSGLHAIAPKKINGRGLREKICLMYLEGLSQSEMARRLGVSRQAVSKAKKSLESLAKTHHAGRYLNPRTGEASVSDDVLEVIKLAQTEGLSLADTAKRVGLNKATVEGLIRLSKA